MKRGAGKVKGHRFERDIAKALSLWLTAGVDATQLVRSVGSGGWQSRDAAIDRWRQCGDIAPNGDIGAAFRRVFSLECKFHRGINVWPLWLPETGGKDSIFKWWEHIRVDALAVGTQPMLIFKANGTPTMIMLHGAMFEQRVPEGWLLSDLTTVAVYPRIHTAVAFFDDLLKCDPARIIREPSSGWAFIVD